MKLQQQKYNFILIQIIKKVKEHVFLLSGYHGRGGGALINITFYELYIKKSNFRLPKRSYLIVMGKEKEVYYK